MAGNVVALLTVSGVSGPLSQRVGTHVILELSDGDVKTLNEPSVLSRGLQGAATAAGLTVLDATFHKFQPQGVTGLLLLSESHLSVHTWPELGYAAVDLFSCGMRLEMPCGESLSRAGGGGEVTMRMSLSMTPNGTLREWVCADGSPFLAQHHLASHHGEELPWRTFDSATTGLKDLWQAVRRIVDLVDPAHARLRRFERGVPGTEAADAGGSGDGRSGTAREGRAGTVGKGARRD